HQDSSSQGLLSAFIVSVDVFGFHTSMTDKRTSGKYIEESDVIVDIKDQDLGILFADGTSPPRIQKLDLLSCFTGSLMVGDLILQVDKKAIRTARDFFDAAQVSGNEVKTVRIRYRRDTFYQIRVLKVAANKRRPNIHTLTVQIRWRDGLTVGLNVDKKVILYEHYKYKNGRLQGSNILITGIEPNSVAAIHFRLGDIILEVNDKKVTDVSATKKAIKQGFINKNNAILRIERDVTPAKRICDPAEDVQTIITRNSGFWNRPSRLRAIDEEGKKPQRVYNRPETETEPLPVDDYGKALISTPNRDGGAARSDEAAIAETEEETTEEEEVEYIRAGTIHELYLYPIKSCKANKVEWIDCKKRGASNGEEFDRHFLLVDSLKDNLFLTARIYPKMVLIEANVLNKKLIVKFGKDHPSSNSYSLFSDAKTEGFDCGDEIGQAFDEFLEVKDKRELRLIWFGDEEILYTERDENTKNEYWLNNKVPELKDEIAFHDLASFMAFSLESITDLNKHLKKTGISVDSRYFRPTLVISGLPPFDEDSWLKVKAGEAEFICYKPCTRYRLAPGKLYEQYKESPVFGVNMAIIKPGRVCLVHKGCFNCCYCRAKLQAGNAAMEQSFFNRYGPRWYCSGASGNCALIPVAQKDAKLKELGLNVKKTGKAKK
ncbi:hypothetical protein Mgra_00009087, partial [Meloidogyne graminicola]